MPLDSPNSHARNPERFILPLILSAILLLTSHCAQLVWLNHLDWKKGMLVPLFGLFYTGVWAQGAVFVVAAGQRPRTWELSFCRIGLLLVLLGCLSYVALISVWLRSLSGVFGLCGSAAVLGGISALWLWRWWSLKE